jgi:predicted membrane GTPase involved in stress response
MKIRMIVEYDNDAKVDQGDTTIVNKMLKQEKQYWIANGLDIKYVLAVGGTVTFELAE